MPSILGYAHAYIGHGREAGAETTLADLLESLVADGWEATMLISQTKRQPKKPYTINGVKVIPEKDTREFRHMVQANSVLISHLECSERSAFVAQRENKPLVQLIHNTMWQTDGYLSEGCDLAVYNSEWVADHHNKTPRKPIVAVPQPGLAGFSDRLAFKARATYSWPHVIVHPQVNPEEYKTTPGTGVGFVNLHSNKNPHVFFEMARRFPNRDFYALKGGYGDQEIEFVPNVTILENTPRIRDEFYSKIGVLLMPSDYESFGRVAVEAAASGIPTIASPTPGLLESLGIQGLFAEPTDLDGWEKTLKRLVPGSPAYRKASKNALRCSAHWAYTASVETKNFQATMRALHERRG